jgi:ABC-2 type transport system ATP-binding protein
MLEVRNLTYGFQGKSTEKDKPSQSVGQADFQLQDISFTLEKGYILGLLGLNGAGKSTLMKMIMGMDAPTGGSISLYGESMWENSAKLRQKIGWISDDTVFLNYRTLDENVDLFGILYEDFQREKWESYMEEFGFDKGDLEHLYGTLSTGEKRKFQLAFALSYKPELLLLDEVTANLDPHARVSLLELVQNQVAEEEISAVISTHLTEDLDEIADYILVLENGRQKMFMDREEMVDRFGEIGLRELLG